MGKVKDVASSTVQMLGVWQKQAESLVNTIDQLQIYLDEEPRTVIQESLDQLLSRIRAEAAKIISGAGVVIVSPKGTTSVEENYNIHSDFWLERLKSKGFFILTLKQFRAFIQSLKSEVAEGNLIPVIEFLRANTKFEWPSVYLPAPNLRETQPRESSSSEWKLSDFLPAPPPHPPLPRGLFKD
ncbi:unnamed protein product [marine sediment metagenome]|uniref:Uncharacterized protein n=1 Tax=marine sediment metagenome TaxID=412755 RepID=X1PL45_9ZZZZ